MKETSCTCTSDAEKDLRKEVEYYRSLLVEISNLIMIGRSPRELLKIIESGLREN